MLLALLAVVALVAAVVLERRAGAPAPTRARSAVTPVLSARRVPELLAAPVAERRLAARLAPVMAAMPGPSCLSVSVGGRTVFDANPSASLLPASVEKLATATAVLAKLDPQQRFTTTVRGTVSGGAVSGDLALVGGGDPLLMTDDYFAALEHQPPERTSLERLADQVVAAGVRQVDGGIVGDDSLLDRQRAVAGWPARYTAEGDVGPLSALLVDDGAAAFPARIKVRGARPAPAADPAAEAAARFRDLLVARGVAVSGEPSSGTAPAGAPAIASIDSAPVASLVGEMLRESDNETAELLTRQLGRLVGGAPTTEAGVAVISSVVGTADGVSRADGSGLSRDDRVTCPFVRGLLDGAGTAGAIAANLPVAGSTGTLFDRFLGSPVAGRLRAKTGSLFDVSALAGYLPTAGGGDIRFALVLNLDGRRVTDADRAREQDVAAALDTYPEAVDLAAIGPRPLP